MAGSRRDASIERLADLPHNHEIVHSPVAQWAKEIRPSLRKGLLSSTKTLDKAIPCIGRREFTGA
jgi:hypothetical protein